MSDTLIEFDEFTNLAHRLYKYLGTVPYHRTQIATPRSKWWKLVFALIVLNLNFVFVGEVTFVVMSVRNQTNFIEASLNLSFIGFVFVSDVKLWNIWYKKAQMTHFMHDLKALFPKTKRSQTYYDLEQHLRRHKTVTVPYVITHIILLYVYNFFAMGIYYVYKYVLDKDVERALPYFIWVPWDFADNWTYFVLFAMETLAGQSAFCGQLASDVLLYMSATQITMHYRYLAKLVEDYEAGKAGDMAFIGYVAEYHQKILYLTDIMNDIFGVPLLWNFLFSSLNICFVAFSATMGNTEIIAMLVIYLVCALVQVFLIGTYSQELIEASTSVGHAVYNHNWHNAGNRYKKMLSLITQRAQEPAMLRATNFLPISMATVTEVVQISYKFFALLKTIYVD